MKKERNTSQARRKLSPSATHTSTAHVQLRPPAQAWRRTSACTSACTSAYANTACASWGKHSAASGARPPPGDRDGYRPTRPRGIIFSSSCATTHMVQRAQAQQAEARPNARRGWTSRHCTRLTPNTSRPGTIANNPGGRLTACETTVTERETRRRDQRRHSGALSVHRFEVL